MPIKHHRFGKNLLALAVGLSVSTLVFAQESVQELDITEIEGESIDRDAVVDVIDFNEINERQVDNFEDLVRDIPGVSVSRGDDRWGSSGFNIRGLDEDRVAINVDGIPQGETLKYEGGQAYGYFKGSRNGVDIEALKAVEIVKGADALLSGSGALAGAVNMTTKDPSDFLSLEGNDSGFSIKFGYSGVNDEGMVSLAAANRTGNMESLVIYTRRDGHEFKSYDMDALDVDGAGREIPDPQDREQDSILGKLQFDLGGGHRLGFVGSVMDRNTMTDVRSFNGGWYSNRMGEDVSEVTRIGVEYDYDAGEGGLFDTLSMALNQQDIEFSAETTQHVMYNFGPTFQADEDRVSTRSFDQELTHFTTDLTKVISSGGLEHDLVYGLELQQKSFFNYTDKAANSNLNDLGWVEEKDPDNTLIPEADADVLTVYIADRFALEGGTRFRVGGRFDDYTYDAQSGEYYTDGTGTLQEVSFSAFTWTVGIEQPLSEMLTLEAGVSTGFRAPTIEDMYSTSGSYDDWGVIANPDLEAEYSTNIDIALAGKFEGGRYRIGTFYSEYDDFIDYELRTGTNTNTGEPDPNGWQVPTNSNEVEMKGLEFSAFADMYEAFGFASGFTTSLQAAYTDGEQANGDPVYSVQPFSVSWGLSYNPNEVWGVSLQTTYTEGKDNSDSYQTDDMGDRTYPLYLSNTATILDLMAYYDISDNFRVRAGVNNLTDKKYYHWDSVRFVDQGDLRPGIGVTGNGILRYSEPGRTFEISATYQF